ncbi:dynein heavy chain 5, axonemal, partial [Caerostris extrusa]
GHLRSDWRRRGRSGNAQILMSQIIRSPGGHALLVGVGGSGKQSLTKLAAFHCSLQHPTDKFNEELQCHQLLEDLKILYRTTGIRTKGTTFIFTDQALKDECFFGILKQCSDMWSREKLRARSLKFPGIVSGCTVDWFQPWPKEALTSVSRHFLKDFDMQCDQVIKQEVILFMGDMHNFVAEQCNEYYQSFPPRSRYPQVLPVVPRRLPETVRGRSTGRSAARAGGWRTASRSWRRPPFLVGGMKETLAVMEGRGAGVASRRRSRYDNINNKIPSFRISFKTSVGREVSREGQTPQVVRDSVGESQECCPGDSEGDPGGQGHC